MSGTSPQAFDSLVIHMKELRFLNLEEMKLSGSIPEVMGSWESLIKLELNVNKLTGMIPESSASLTLLFSLGLRATGLSGTILPIVSMPRIKKIFLQFNRFSGSIPSGMACLRHLQGVLLDDNQITGTITSVLRLVDMDTLQLPFNKLSGSVPTTPMESMQLLNLNHNSLSGSIPNAVLSLPGAFIGLACNQLSGALQAAILSKTILISDNQLTGSLPRLAPKLVVLVCWGNLLEGTVPPVAAVNKLQIFDVTGRPGERRGLEGPLPLGLGRTKLGHLLVAHQNLGGMGDHLTATLSTLSLHSNRLKVMPNAHLSEDGAAVVLIHNNDMSCHLPTLGREATKLSLSAPGNHMQRPSGGFPAWVLPMERAEILWTSDRDGLGLLLKVSGASICLVFAISCGYGNVKLMNQIFRWTAVVGHRRLVVLSFSQLLQCIMQGALMRAPFLMILTPWDRYKCPWTLALASFCLRDNALTHILVLSLWIHLVYVSPAAKCLTDLGQRKGMTTKGLQPKLLSWLCWVVATLFLSFLPILSLASKSVPQLFGLGDGWLSAISLCIGCFQAFVGVFVLPPLADKFTAQKYAFTTLTNLLMNCLFPALAIAYLDAKCCGNWVALWEPCWTKSARFHKELNCRRLWTGKGYACQEVFNSTRDRKLDSGDFHYTILRESEVCDAQTAGGRRSFPECVELVLLRLQDLWLGKLISSGLLIPAYWFGSNTLRASRAETITKVTSLVAYAMMASGHLPLVVFLVLLAILSEALLAAAALNPQGRMDHIGYDIATPTLALARFSSSIAHVASASRHGGVWLMSIMAVLLHILGHLGIELRPWD